MMSGLEVACEVDTRVGKTVCQVSLCISDTPPLKSWLEIPVNDRYLCKPGLEINDHYLCKQTAHSNQALDSSNKQHQTF
jgi:hypothetical protein